LLHRNPTVAQAVGVVQIQFVGPGRFSSGSECGPPAFAAITQQRELTHDEYFSPDVVQSQIHPLAVVLKDTQAIYLTSQPDDVILGVVGGHSQQNNEADINLPNDFTANCDGPVGNSLNNGTHYESTCNKIKPHRTKSATIRRRAGWASPTREIP